MDSRDAWMWLDGKEVSLALYRARVEVACAFNLFDAQPAVCGSREHRCRPESADWG
jgi:hypothetical protein